MTNRTNKITISRGLLNILKEEVVKGDMRPKMHAIISPGARDQRIARLVSAEERIFEDDMTSRTDTGIPVGGMGKSIVSFGLHDIDRIHKIQNFIRNSFINENSQDCFQSSDRIGNVEYRSWGHNDDFSTTISVSRDHVKFCGKLKTGLELHTEKVEIDLLTRVYSDRELMTFEELMRSPYKVFVIDGKDEEIELNAETRIMLTVGDKPAYDQFNPHPEYPVESWVNEINNNETFLGYGDWVLRQVEAGNNVNHQSGVVYVGYDQAIDEALTSDGLGLLKYTLGKQNEHATAIDKNYVVFMPGTTSVDGESLNYLDADGKTVDVNQCFEHFSAKGFAKNNPGFFEVIETPSQLMCAADIKTIVSLPESCDGITVQDLINELTDKKADYQGNGVWEVDDHLLGSDEVAKLLLSEFCVKTPEQLAAAIGRIEFFIDDSRMSL